MGHRRVLYYYTWGCVASGYQFGVCGDGSLIPPHPGRMALSFFPIIDQEMEVQSLLRFQAAKWKARLELRQVVQGQVLDTMPWLPDYQASKCHLGWFQVTHKLLSLQHRAALCPLHLLKPQLVLAVADFSANHLSASGLGAMDPPFPWCTLSFSL